MTAAGSYLRRIEVGGAGGQHVRGALAVYGGSIAYADQVLALSEPAATSNLPVVLPHPGVRLGPARSRARLARGPRGPHESVRRHEPVRGRRPRDRRDDARW